MKRTTVGGLTAALTASVLFLPGTATGGPALAAPAAEPPSLDGLRVLLTNDDSAQAQDTARGTDGRGLYELRQELCAAGADVVVVAPWSQQSGAGGRVTTPGGRPVPITVQAVASPAEYAGDCGDAPSGGPVYGVCVAASPCTATSPSASPSDAVLVGLSRVVPDHYWSDGPDVVLSGINFGQNVGELVNHSGTVGAAVTAQEQHVPSVAFSAEVSFADLTATPFAQTAEFAVGLIERLVEVDALSRADALNVNFPFVGADEQLGRPVLTVTGAATDIAFDYSGDVGVEGGTYQLVVGAPTDEPRRRADTTALRNNDIAITPLDGDWTAHTDGDRYRRILQGWRP
ncbi:hypothetical protein D0Z08_23120 [Nocardioides immobilis]|uniref:5'-nucleotidase n=1 Tax=Nocardioides immobilis TaxID=2049295 RepID=A0A417XW81_9ACTN|nr:5'/3'-nucleotidase SurE [Nocardioides immobilis]RHW24633.1 hypothetical protein D0Z08_23120 [Nocardioides immobilis]